VLLSQVLPNEPPLTRWSSPTEIIMADSSGPD
jgi:hypothetical protein